MRMGAMWVSPSEAEYQYMDKDMEVQRGFVTCPNHTAKQWLSMSIEKALTFHGLTGSAKQMLDWQVQSVTALLKCEVLLEPDYSPWIWASVFKQVHTKRHGKKAGWAITDIY